MFILSQGSKAQITYQIVKGIVQDQSIQKPVISILFVGEGIGDFALKEQFNDLEENNDNLNIIILFQSKERGSRLWSDWGLVLKKLIKVSILIQTIHFVLFVLTKMNYPLLSKEASLTKKYQDNTSLSTEIQRQNDLLIYSFLNFEIDSF